MSHAIVVDDLHFSWPDGGTLFDGLNFTVGPGRTALIGVNGSGKSALLRLIVGKLVPPPARSGSPGASATCPKT